MCCGSAKFAGDLQPCVMLDWPEFEDLHLKMFTKLKKLELKIERQ